MEIRLTLRSGMPGTKRLVARFGERLVCVRVAWNETELRAAVKQAGAIWRPQQKLWEMSWEAVRALGIDNRVVTG